MNKWFCLHRILSSSFGNRTHLYSTFVYVSLLLLPSNTQPWCYHPSHYLCLPDSISPSPVDEHITQSVHSGFPLSGLWIKSEMIQDDREVELRFSSRPSGVPNQHLLRYCNSWPFWDRVYHVFLWMYCFSVQCPSNKLLLSLLTQPHSISVAYDQRILIFNCLGTFLFGVEQNIQRNCQFKKAK